MAASPLVHYHPSNINILVMEKISQEAVGIFEKEGFTVREAVR